MKAQKQVQFLHMDIKPQEYSSKNTKQLGNHFMHSKINPNDKWNDHRLKVLPPDYFRGKYVLDIGCNEGILSIPIAIKYHPQRINAIDIDTQMIKKAKNNVQIFVNKNEHYKYPKQVIQQIQTLPLLLQQKLSKRFGSIIVQLNRKFEIRPKEVDPNSLFPHNIDFSTQNILAPRQLPVYDCILCMNVTKWIHLAFGDQGVKELFESINLMSGLGTILILQCQPYTSYRKKKNLYPSYKQNYKMILFKPEKFKDYLRGLGFEIREIITPTPANLLKHQIMVFQKKQTQ